MKKKIATEAHQFALFYEPCSTLFGKAGMHVDLNDPPLVHRIARVLRLAVGETCILFDRKQHAQVRVVQIDKKNVSVVVEQIKQNRIIKPEITCYVPLLKKEALEQALYACVELGATQVQLIKTHKVHRVYSSKELDHARACMIAAAEQSKNVVFPVLDEIRDFNDVVQHLSTHPTIFCDPTGKPLLEVLNTLHADKPAHVGIMIGPEGDLTAEEKELLVQNKVIFCKLTPTILRAQDALVVAVGALRSSLRE
ncbi:MAG: 16S rRNA (uracil(1498)-N(3))-methyltransferase [Candidatus Babeliales bacterium]